MNCVDSAVAAAQCIRAAVLCPKLMSPVSAKKLLTVLTESYDCIYSDTSANEWPC